MCGVARLDDHVDGTVLVWLEGHHQPWPWPLRVRKQALAFEHLRTRRRYQHRRKQQPTCITEGLSSCSSGSLSQFVC